MKTLPDHVSAYKKTPEFTEVTVPAGLLKDHQTKADVWAKIVVLEGQLDYIILEPSREPHRLNKQTVGIVEPTRLHYVKPYGSVRFYVEFYR